MKNALLALFVVPLLTVPAFAGSSSVGDKPMGVADRDLPDHRNSSGGRRQNGGYFKTTIWPDVNSIECVNFITGDGVR
jgi:hypothetical protein